MKNKLQKIKNSWTFNHKMAIIALSLALAHIWPLIQFPTLQAETITYEKPPQTQAESLEQKIERKTDEIYKALEPINKERARQEALREVSDELLQLTYTSPYIDYEAMNDKYPQ